MKADTQDLKNRLIFKNRLLPFFSYTKKSEELLNHRLIYEKAHSPEFENFFQGKSRIKFDIDIKEMTWRDAFYIDSSTRDFYDNFTDAINALSITPEMLYNNYVPYDGNNFKIKKALEKFYLESRQDAINPEIIVSKVINYLANKKTAKKRIIEKIFNESFDSMSDVRFSEFISFINNSFRYRVCNIHSMDNPIKEFNKILIKNKFFEFSLEEILNEKEIKELKKEIFEYVKNLIDKVLSAFNNKKINLNSMIIVFSRDPIDMLMASTGESWSSCISLDSSYEEAFWSGLPSLFTSRNRMIVYLTDGRKKEEHRLKVDRMLMRSWALITRNTKRDKRKTKLFLEKPYPDADFNIVALLNLIPEVKKKLYSIFDDVFSYPEDINENYRTKYIDEMTFHRSVGQLFSSSIYNDSFVLKPSFKSNKAKKEKGINHTYCYLKLTESGSRLIYSLTDNGNSIENFEGGLFCTTRGLRGLIETNCSISRASTIDFYDDDEFTLYDEEDDYDEEDVI